MGTNNTLANRLRVERHRANLTQLELGKRVGSDQTFISRLERGDTMGTPEMLLAIARELGVTVSHLLGEDTDEGRYAKDHPARKFLDDKHAPHGLRELARDGKLVEALRILPHEWERLGSVKLPPDVSKDGYVQLLVCIRAITGGSIRIT